MSSRVAEFQKNDLDKASPGAYRKVKKVMAADESTKARFGIPMMGNKQSAKPPASVVFSNAQEKRNADREERSVLGLKL